MAEISKITDITGTTYDIKDTTARSSVSGKVDKSGDTMTGDLTLPNVIVKGTGSSVVPSVMGRNQNSQSLGTIDFFTDGKMQFRCYNVGIASENYFLPTPTATNATEYSILTSKVTGTLPAGIWIVQFMAIFASNSTGYRQIGLGTSAAETHMNRYCKSVVQAANGNDTQISITTVVTPSTQTTYYLNVVQTSGSSLSVTGGLDARRLL